MGEALDKGTFGEQGAGFYLGAEGYYFVDGPSGTAGHGANAAGFDGIAFNPTTQDLIIYDNKTYSRTGNIGSATAIDPDQNLVKNLDALISKVQGMRELPDHKVILDKLNATRATIANGTVAPPKGVKIAVSNFGSKTSGVSGKLGARGIEHIDMMSRAPRVPPRDKYIDRKAIVGIATGMPMVNHEYMRRAAKGEAIAAAAEMLMNALVDYTLAAEIDDATEDCAQGILAGQSRGMGSLMVYTVANIPMGVLMDRRLSDVSRVEGKTDREAYLKWERQPFLGRGWGSQVTTNRIFRWIEPITKQ
jgi:hypothetical protein